MYINEPDDRSWDSFVLILILVASTITLSGVTYSEKIFSASFIGKLGKISKYLFLNHYYWALVLPTLPIACLGKGLYFVLSICSTFIVYLLIIS